MDAKDNGSWSAHSPRHPPERTQDSLKGHRSPFRLSCKFWSPFSLPHLDFLQSRSRHLQVHIFLSTAPSMQKNLLILWACEALKVTHRLPTWPKTSRMNKLHKLRQPAQIVSANWIVLSACPLARAPRWMRRTTEAGLRIHHGTPSICAIFHPRTHVVALVSLAPWAPALAPLAHRV